MKNKGRSLKAIAEKLSDTAQAAVLEAAKNTAQDAIHKAPGPVKSAIKTEIEQNFDPDLVAARVYNDTMAVPWSSYTEFGTGRYVDNEGVTEAIRLKRAKSIPWYIHISMVPASFARYNYPLVERNGEKYWEVDGMAPHPYMMPAAQANRQKSIEILAKKIEEMIRSVT